MAEATDAASESPPASAAALGRAELERLTELVYRLLREDLLLQRERQGSSAADWR